MIGLHCFVWGVAVFCVVALVANGLVTWLTWQVGAWWAVAPLLGIEGGLAFWLVQWLRTMVPALHDCAPREDGP